MQLTSSRDGLVLELDLPTMLEEFPALGEEVSVFCCGKSSMSALVHDIKIGIAKNDRMGKSNFIINLLFLQTTIGLIKTIKRIVNTPSSCSNTTTLI
jgi:hypothetical protein